MPKIFQAGLLLVLGALLGVAAVTLKHEISGTPGERHAVNGEMLNCPKGSAPRWERWGGPVKQGWAHYCQMNHGPYQVWIDDRLYIEGEFQFGEKSGEWSIRSEKDGTLLKQRYEPSNSMPDGGNRGSE